jgi:Protein of unknown function (DUF3551)
MKKFALMVAAASALAAPALVTSSTRVEATEYPYCMTYVAGWSGIIERCDFSTMDQCRASASGLNGGCAVNWRYTQAQIVERPIKRRYRERAY